MGANLKDSNKKVIKGLLLVFLTFLAVLQYGQNNFKASQTKYKRVKSAYDSKWTTLQNLLVQKGISKDNFELHIRCFKSEKETEVWARNKGSQKFTLIKTIPICATSGELGPKRRQGDGQIPEGIYHVSWFNPMSDYHLGMKINYPNQSDKIKANGNNAGGDIMIHGYCVTIGCIPLQNDPIEELYVLCVESKNSGYEVGVSIFPFRMNDTNWQAIQKNEEFKSHLDFWKQIKKAYDHFELNKAMPAYKINKTGDYEFQVQ